MLCSQAGFEQFGYKDVVVPTKEKDVGQATLRVYPVDGAEPALVMPLNYAGPFQWGRHYYAASLSDFTRPRHGIVLTSCSVPRIWPWGRTSLGVRSGWTSRRRTCSMPGGRNVAGVSNMAGVGWKWVSQYTSLQAIPGHHDGVMPGAVCKGYGIGRGRFWSIHNVRIASMPTGFPHAILPNPYYTMHQTANNEVWGFVNVTFMLAASEVHLAIETLRARAEEAPPAE